MATHLQHPRAVNARLATLIAFGLVAAPRLAQAQVSAEAVAPCTVEVAVDRTTSPRLWARMRALAAVLSARDTSPGACEGRVRLGMSAQRLQVEIALDDGRVAQRSLRSLEDVLPTVLAVLAAPSTDGPEGAEREAPAPTVTAPPPRPAPPVDAAEDAARPPASASAPQPLATPGDAWRPLVGLSLGEQFSLEAQSQSVARVELGWVRRHLRAGLRLSLGHATTRADRPDGDNDDDDHGETSAERRRRDWVFDGRVGVDLAARLHTGRFALELGGTAMVRQAWSNDVAPLTSAVLGVNATAVWALAPQWRLTGSLEALNVLRTDEHTVGLTLGVRWESL